MSNGAFKRMREEIDRLLRERRPDRYTLQGEDIDDPDTIRQTAWLDEIASDVANLVPDSEVRQVLARNQVSQREGIATRRSNDLFRKYHRTGQWPLTVEDLRDEPLAIETHMPQVGAKAKKLLEHVALRAVTSDDLRKFAVAERRRGARDFTARQDSCEGAESIADDMDQHGDQMLPDWWDRQQGDDEE